MFKKKNEPTISFVSTVEGLDQIPECQPRPAAQFVPDWWKTTPRVDSSHKIKKSDYANVKTCPSFPDYFSSGYIIPMWCDSILRFNKKTQEYLWRTSEERFYFKHNNQAAYVDPVSPTHLGRPIDYVFTAHAPWRIITPKGYSIRQLPLFFHFDNDFSVIPGIIDTDFFHSVAFQLFLHKTDEDVFIPRGTPFAHIIPYKRERSNKHEVRYQTEEERLKFAGDDLRYHTKFGNSKEYLKIRKENQTGD
jgi:hypothetical protein